MIVSFGDRATEALYHGHSTKDTRRFPADVRRVAVRKLDMVNAAAALQDLRSPPGNRLEGLHGDLRGFFSIRINDQWRIVFRWDQSDARDVRIMDYHK
jgi:proteic killer suppression protein